MEIGTTIQFQQKTVDENADAESVAMDTTQVNSSETTPPEGKPTTSKKGKFRFK